MHKCYVKLGKEEESDKLSHKQIKFTMVQLKVEVERMKNVN